MSLKDWTASNNDSPYFGVDRYPRLTLPNGRELIPEMYVADFVRRSWKERLFSVPWRPFKKYKYYTIVYSILEEGNLEYTFICSFKTFNYIKEQIAK